MKVSIPFERKPDSGFIDCWEWGGRADNIIVGDIYPSAEVTGLDLSPIQPVWVPPNVRFLVDDVEDSWLNGRDFDFVHLRNMVPVLKSPVGLLKNAYE